MTIIRASHVLRLLSISRVSLLMMLLLAIVMRVERVEDDPDNNVDIDYYDKLNDLKSYITTNTDTSL